MRGIGVYHKDTIQRVNIGAGKVKFVVDKLKNELQSKGFKRAHLSFGRTGGVKKGRVIEDMVIDLTK